MSDSDAHDPDEGIAVIGMVGRFPGAENIDQYWQNLCAGVESLERFERDQIEPTTQDELSWLDGKDYVPVRGVLQHAEDFDANFFGMRPSEAVVTDPQQRVFLEAAWQALEVAGYAPGAIDGPVGVFAGMTNNTYYPHLVQARPDLAERAGGLVTMMANEKDYLATRVSYKLDLKGPAINVQTACSTSLVAVCQAVQSLGAYQCDLALAGGVSVAAPQRRGYLYHEGAIVSPDGRCRPFDEAANGTVFSSGLGVVVLKRLQDALQDGDNILAVIKGAALNNDGSDKVSFTAPSVEGQAEAIAMAQALAGFDPDSIGYVEAHGTGTALGDPVEVAGLTRAFRTGSERTQYCALGSVKGNIGHLDAAAGIAGLIKTILCLEREALPPTLHFRTPNPKLELESSPFFVNDRLRAWNRGAQPRRAGVSSFGVGGTNAHVVLEEAPTRQSSEAPSRPEQLLLISARSEAALRSAADRLAGHLERSEPAATYLADAAYTLQCGRRAFPFRSFAVATTPIEAARQLREKTTKPNRVVHSERRRAKVAFMFPGQGAQFVNMGRQLFEREPVFREELEACGELLRRILGKDLLSILYPAVDAHSEAMAREIGSTAITQPALFAIEYSLARLLISWGIQPSVMIGHSVGEYVAACLGGSMTRDQALAIIAERARLMQALPSGAMLAVRASGEQVLPFLDGEVSVAAYNSPKLTVLSGGHAAIERVQSALSAARFACRLLPTSHAFHSPMVEPALEPFRQVVAGFDLKTPHTSWVSSLTGGWIADARAVDPDYWVQQLRRPVQFAEGAKTLLEDPELVLLEVGPGQTLSTLMRQNPARKSQHSVVSSMGREQELADDVHQLLEAVGQLWAAGVDVDWLAVHGQRQRVRVPLPTYPFERQRFWIDVPEPLAARKASAPTSAAPVFGGVTPSITSDAAGAPSQNAAPEVLPRLTQLFCDLSGLERADLSAELSFVELGLDSLFLTQASSAIERAFGVRVSFRDLLEVVPTLAALAEHIQRLAPDKPAASDLARAPAARKPAMTRVAPAAHGPYRPLLTATAKSGLEPRAQEKLLAFMQRYAQRTSKSKALSQEHRQHFADPRSVAGFRAAWKEVVYPIVVERSSGARLWDVDGNEYIDLTNGFGMILFGHNPAFVRDALQEQLERGIEIGPQSPIAGEVARDLCRMVGQERAAFCNTGSEAVTAAIRVARTVTGRERIVVFDGAYHGVFDEVLVRPLRREGRWAAAPIAPGILPGAVEDVIVLSYGDPEALDVIQNHADEIAAVLVEPIQSRRPSLQPKAFLEQLRAVTRQAGIALVFDEVVTGFRTHAGGVQALYSIDADLSTYGKVLGGGMPIGVVAGKARFMDALDGGFWSFGDTSAPEVGMTFFAGTFVRHPLALAAAHAVLRELEQRGPALQQELNERTERFVQDLSQVASRLAVPLKLTHFSSWLCLEWAPQAAYAHLFYAHMRQRGVHVWEGRPWFLTTEHDAEVLGTVLNAFESSLVEMRESGLLPEASATSFPVSASQTAAASELPLTPAQWEMWAAAQMGAEASASYNQCYPLRLKGAFSMAALTSALNELSQRHAALRLTFSSLGDVQRILPAVRQAPVQVSDWTHLTEDAAQQALQRALVFETSEPFDLANGPLYRVQLLKLAEADHVLVFCAHHIVCDGWSSSILLSDLGRLYSAAVVARQNPLPAPPSYRDWVRQQVERANGEQGAAATSYWQAELAGRIAPLELPTSAPRPRVRTYSGNQIDFPLSAALRSQLARVSAKTQTTLFQTLLSTFYVLLQRLSGQTDLVVGIPAAGQTLLEDPNLVAHAVNSLPLRMQVPPEESYLSLCKRVRGVLARAQEYQDLPFGALLAELDIERDPSRIPLVSVIFNVDRVGAPFAFHDLSLELLTPPKPFTNFELFLNVLDDGKTLTLQMSYNTDLFDEATIRRWLHHYQTLLNACVATPEAEVGLLPLLDPSEVRRLLRDFNPAPSPMHAGARTLGEWLDEQAKRTPDAPALLSDTAGVAPALLSYRQLHERSNQLAHCLRKLGVGRHHIVAVCLRRTSDLVVALLAIVKAGAAYLPLDPMYPRARLSMILEDAQAELVVTEESLRGLLPTAERQRILVDTDWARIQGFPTEAPRGVNEPSDLAYVIYTSGSTGRPKGVAIEHQNCVSLVDWAVGEYTAQQLAGVLCATSVCFDLSVFELFVPLCSGGAVILVDNALDLPASQHRDRVSLLNTVPSAARELLRQGPLPSSVHTINLAGEPLETPLVDALYEAGVQKVYDLYGPTEDTTYSTGIVREARAPATIGRPLKNKSAFILSERGALQPIGVSGELYLGGSGLARGYLNRPELTRERFVECPFEERPSLRLYRTGDLARYRVDGNIEFLGRMDHQVKIRGYRIELGEIELALKQHPKIHDVAVVAHAGLSGQTELVAYCTAAEGVLDIAELRLHLGRTLPEYMLPGAYVLLETLPLTPNGKVDRKALPAPTEERVSRPQTEHVTPRNAVEQRLAKIWKQLLGRRIGVFDDFFALGGHSLLATRMLREIKEEFGLEVPLRSLFEHPTIAGLSEVVSALEFSEHAARAQEVAPNHGEEREEIEL